MRKFDHNSLARTPENLLLRRNRGYLRLKHCYHLTSNITTFQPPRPRPRPRPPRPPRPLSLPSPRPPRPPRPEGWFCCCSLTISRISSGTLRYFIYFTDLN